MNLTDCGCAAFGSNIGRIGTGRRTALRPTACHGSALRRTSSHGSALRRASSHGGALRRTSSHTRSIDGQLPSRHRVSEHLAPAASSCGYVSVNFIDVRPRPEHTTAGLRCVLRADNLHIANHLTQHHQPGSQDGSPAAHGAQCTSEQALG